jgi:hypothetical protein
MITIMKWGAMYGHLEDGEEIAPDPLQLGDHLVKPGDLIFRIGSKKRTMFSMQDGFYLQYVGRVDRYILFNSVPTGCCGDPWHYVFMYVNPRTLLSGTGPGFRDIIADELILQHVDGVTENE